MRPGRRQSRVPVVNVDSEAGEEQRRGKYAARAHPAGAGEAERRHLADQGSHVRAAAAGSARKKQRSKSPRTSARLHMDGRSPSSTRRGQGPARCVKSRRQLLQQRLRLLQIARVESLRKPPVNRSQQFPSLLRLALVAPEAREACCGAQLNTWRFGNAPPAAPVRNSVSISNAEVPCTRPSSPSIRLSSASHMCSSSRATRSFASAMTRKPSSAARCCKWVVASIHKIESDTTESQCEPLFGTLTHERHAVVRCLLPGPLPSLEELGRSV